jgi:murein DD-endopeptidase MepM/ murein hydrolase activator NlpD
MDFIIPDEVFTNTSSMTVDQIQAFLESKKSPLADKELYKKFYLTYPYDMDVYNLVFPNGKLARESSPAEIIFFGSRMQTSQKYPPNRVNPIILLALLEINQDLAEGLKDLDQHILDNVFRLSSYELGDYDLSPLGFLNQIIAMAYKLTSAYESSKNSSNRIMHNTDGYRNLSDSINAATYAIKTQLKSSSDLFYLRSFLYEYLGFAQSNKLSFQFPLDVDWNITCNNFWSCCLQCWHLGEDVLAAAGTPVFALADGIVKHTNTRTQYGNVIIIEHDLGGEVVCSVMAHLRDTDMQVNVGQQVEKGQWIGSIGNVNQNGGWEAEHIHFGIRKGTYAGDYATTCGGAWVYAGYAIWPDCSYVQNDWYLPSDFVKSHQISWDFSTVSNREGWRGQNIEQPLSSGNYAIDLQGNPLYYLAIDPAVSDPYVTSPPLSISAADYNAVHIRMASNAPDGVGNIYFVTSDKPTWSEDKKVRFNVSNYSLSTTAPYFEYIVYMGAHQDWTGTITGIRIDPADTGVIGSYDTIGIDFIRLEKLNRVAPSVDFYIVPNQASFSTGETQAKWVTASGGAGYSVNNYVRVTRPNGTQQYVYYPNYPVQSTDPLSFSDIKRPLYNGTWVVGDSSWNWNTYTFAGTEAAGNYTWEYWYEDVNWQSADTEPGVLASDSLSYDFSPSSLIFSGYLDSGNTSATHAVTLPADGELRLNIVYDSTLDISALGKGIRVYDTSGCELYYESYPSSGVVYGPYGMKAGTHNIKVLRYSGYGAYSLTATYNAQIIPADVEPNDTFSDSKTAPINGSVTGHLGYKGGGNCATDSVDIFNIMLSADGELKLKIVYDSTLDISFTTYGIRIYDTSGCELYYESYPSSGVLYGPYGTKAGTYYIKILRSSGYGGYTLTTMYNAQTISADVEPNDTFSDSKTAPINGSVTGHLGYKGGGNCATDTVDIFNITLPADGELKFKIVYDSSLNLSWTTYGIRIYDTTGCEVYYENYPSSGVIYGPYGMKAGTYYIKIIRYSGYGGYTLTTMYNAQTISADVESNDTFPDSKTAPINGSVTGHLGYKGGGNCATDTVDIYNFTLSADSEMKFKIVYDSTLNLSWATYGIRIYDASEYEVFHEYYPSSGVEYGPKALTAGTYYIKILRYSGYGGYTLTTIFPSITPSTITVSSPNGGENWIGGSNHTITWTSTGTVGNVKVEHSINNGGSWSTITSSAPNDGNEPWAIPNTPSNACLVRISEAADGDPSDTSNSVFTISAQQKKDFNGDGQEDILWRYYGPGGYNVVWYLGDSGGGLGRIENSAMKKPVGEHSVVDMLKGQTARQVFRDAREAGGLMSKKAAQRVFGDAREAGGLMTREDTQTQRGVPTMRDPREMGGAGVNAVPVMRVTGTAWIGNGWLPAVTDTSWEIVGTGDFNADGNVDILWRNYSLGYNVIWYMDGVTWIGNEWLPAVTDTNWKIEATGDFNTDGNVDILWRDYGLGYNVIWYMDRETWIDNGWLPAVTDTNWKIAGTGDFNGDGRVDILWRYYGAGGHNLVWYMDGATWIGNGWLPAVTDTNWKMEGTGDFDGDGKVDILWRDYSLGYNVIWYMDGATWIGNEWLPTVPDINWRIENH